MVDTGLKDAGYDYVNLDCGWTTGFRDPKTHKQLVNTTRYPYGIKSLADYVHSLRLKFGIYTSASTNQCCSKIYPTANDGSLDYEDIDAKQYAAWGVDYLKFDGCGQEQRSYPAMRDALNSTGRPIFLSINCWNMSTPNPGSVSNTWRTTGDDDVDFIPKLMADAFENDATAAWQRVGAYNNPDMLEIGNYPITDIEARAQFSLWCAIKAPLIIGTDVTNMTAATLEILTNKELIEISQDPLGVQARKVWGSAAMVDQGSGKPRAPVPKHSVWAGPLEGDAHVAVLFNADTKAADITLKWGMLSPPLAEGSELRVRDVWKHDELGVHKASFTAHVPAHGAVALRLRK